MVPGREAPRYLIQAKIREFNREMSNHPFEIPGFNAFQGFAASLRDLPISSKLDLCLKYCAELSRYPGDQIDPQLATDFPLAYSKSPDEFKFYLDELTSECYLRTGGHFYTVSAEGWLK